MLQLTMLIKQKIGNINSYTGNNTIDWLALEWYETSKRILHKKTNTGREIVLKFLKKNPELNEGDILWQDEHTLIAVTIKPCDVIVIKPKNNFEVASVCYEIGNKHLPLFYEDDELLVAYEAPLFGWLQASGYQVNNENRKLINALKTTVASHVNTSNSLFNKILQITTVPADGK